MRPSPLIRIDANRGFSETDYSAHFLARFNGKYVRFITDINTYMINNEGDVSTPFAECKSSKKRGIMVLPGDMLIFESSGSWNRPYAFARPIVTSEHVEPGFEGPMTWCASASTAIIPLDSVITVLYIRRLNLAPKWDAMTKNQLLTVDIQTRVVTGLLLPGAVVREFSL